jgi:DtxR family transcriptional regulator, Mn-dependent transcriptional regulator
MLHSATMDTVLSKSEREMLKAVYRLSKGGSDAHTGALAEHLGIAPGTVTTTVKRLAERNLVDHRPYKGVELLPSGRTLAVAAIRRHRIVERFLSDMLHYPWHDADRLAGAFEHELPQEIEERMYETLGRPATCPHGFPIPDASMDRVPQLPSLDGLQPGESGVVALSGSTDPDVVAFLDTLGIRPGVFAELIEKQPFDGPVVVRIDGVDRMVGERVAAQIFVQADGLTGTDAGRPETEAVDGLNRETSHKASTTGKARKDRSA